jgi:hypothetical protein
MVNITVDANDVIGGMEELPDDLHQALNTSLGISLSRMQTYAQFTHRYKTRTGRLSSAISSEVKDLMGELFIDENKAYYGKYVHEGHGTWAPDQFIYGSAEANTENLMSSLNQALDSAIKKVRF